MSYRQTLIDLIKAPSAVPVEQLDITVGTVKTAYLQAGNGPAVICLHGAGAGAVTWYPSLGALAEKYRVIVPDIIGYGESDKPDGAYDRPFFAAWLRDFMQALGIARAHIVGLSQGGAIALQLALENPELVDKLVLVDSAALGAQPSLLSFISMLWMNLLPSDAASRFQSRFLLNDTAKRAPAHRHYSVEVLKKLGGKQAFSQGRGAAVAPMAEAELQCIDHQTLIVWGEDDNFFPMSHGQAAAEKMPNASFQSVPGAGHLPLMDQPEIFNQALLKFLAS